MQMKNISIHDIDQILPQTQCTKCGYDDCLAYAKAIYSGIPYNQCPPGGQIGINKLSKLLDHETMKLNPDNGIEKPKEVAIINEDLCIGCKKCILACPVDAIIGTGKQMHTVITQDCSGCELCIAPCPMDCIEMVELSQELQPENMAVLDFNNQKDIYRSKHQKSIARVEKQQKTSWQEHQSNKKLVSQNKDQKKQYIAAALANFRKKKINQNNNYNSK
ncbi:MAG: electron transport complex protein RnfB [Francisellaceae bacterium]|jgi:electron transport complex protein RnfB